MFGTSWNSGHFKTGKSQNYLMFNIYAKKKKKKKKKNPENFKVLDIHVRIKSKSNK